jgi:hypothetical protein
MVGPLERAVEQFPRPLEHIGVTKDCFYPHLLGDRGRNIWPYRADRQPYQHERPPGRTTSKILSKA